MADEKVKKSPGYHGKDYPGLGRSGGQIGRISLIGPIRPIKAKP